MTNDYRMDADAIAKLDDHQVRGDPVRSYGTGL